MVSPLKPAVEVPIESETDSPEMIRARNLIEKIEALESPRPNLSPNPGKRHSDRLANSRRLLQSRIASIPDFERHSRKCQVCHSRWVEEIEQAYYNWSSTQWIINAFQISYDDSVYRHSRAIGLDARRRKNVGIAVEKLIEKVDEVTVTSSTVLRAIRALSLLDDNGRWTDPPSTHIVLTSKDLPQHVTTTEKLGASSFQEQVELPVSTVQHPASSVEPPECLGLAVADESAEAANRGNMEN